MRRTAIAATVACAGLLTVSLVSPAFGGPSVTGIAKQAKKALKIGKSAKRAAASATRTANQARDTADAASGTASQALGQAGRVSTVTISQEVAAAPGTFAEFDLRCPGGYVPTGHGAGNGALDLVFTGPLSNGFIAAMSNLGGADTYSGILYVICAKGAWAATASLATTSRAEAMRSMRAAEAAVTASN